LDYKFHYVHAAINFILPQQNLPLVGDQQAPCQYNKIICRGQSQSGNCFKQNTRKVLIIDIRERRRKNLHIVDGHFGKPNRKKKPSNMSRKELVSG